MLLCFSRRRRARGFRRATATCTAALSILGFGCSDDSTPVPETGSVVVGVTSDLRAGVDVDRLHVRMSAGGAVIRDEDLTGEALAFPKELAFVDVDADSEVIAELGAFVGTSPLLLDRRAATRVVAGRTLLLPARLQGSCVAGLSGSSAPECEAPETCISGACAASFVEPGQLAEYAPDWHQAPDPCITDGGAPVVVVGEGQADYLPMADGDIAQVEAGPQGGFHIWVAVRVKNLAQSGSITEVSGAAPGLDFDVPPFKVIFTFDQDEGGFCKLPGLRFRLDTPTVPIEELLGRTLEVHVKVTDKNGVTGEGKRIVQLSDEIL